MPQNKFLSVQKIPEIIICGNEIIMFRKLVLMNENASKNGRLIQT